jgi:TorA maturation chaperone TorD
VNRPNIPTWLAAYEEIRTDSYAMLAALLTQPPSADLLKILEKLEWETSLPRNLDAALAELCRAGRERAPGELEDEYNRLFVGLGRGELVPYASWYRDGKISSMPLVFLRSSLRRLGIVKRADSAEPEDHAGALCEVMTLLSAEPDDTSRAEQMEFFRQHIAPWMPAFFRDLQSAKNAGFYRAVARFGDSLLETESEFFKYGTEQPSAAREGGRQDED